MGVPSVGGIAPVLSRIGQIESRIGRDMSRAPLVLQASSPSTSFTSVYEQLPIDQISSSSALGQFAADPYGVTEYATRIGSTDSSYASTGVSTSSAGSSGRSLTEVLGHAGIPAGTPFTSQFADSGARHGVPPSLLAAMGWVESRYQTDAVSPDGAMGVMQIMPMTAQELGVDPWDPTQAIDGAARLLADNYRRFGSWELAVASYYSGPGAVARNGNQAPPGGAAYVNRVVQRLEGTSP